MESFGLGVTSTSSLLPVLVVEDDEPTQRLLEALLRRTGMTSHVVSNGAEAIAALKRNSYVAVILDLMMPEVGGRDVIDYLAASSSNVPVIVCSAAGQSALAGFDPRVVKAIIRKPFDVSSFFDALRSIAPPDDSTRG